MAEWMTRGCERCRQGVLAGSWPPPERLVVSIALHAFLHRCSICGAYWLFGEREAHVITEAEAHADFPEAFAPNPEATD